MAAGESIPIEPITDAGYPFDRPKADVILRSYDNVDFRVFKLFLSFASPVFETMFGLPQSLPEVSQDETKDGLPVILLQENGRVLKKLLMLCYPISLAESVSLDSLNEALSVLDAATKYGMEAVEKYVLKLLVSPISIWIQEKPLRIFAFALGRHFHAEARMAAKYTLRLPWLAESYTTELEDITGGALYRLQQYRFRCGEAASDVARTPRWVLRSILCFEKHECVFTWSAWMSAGLVPRWWRDFMENEVAAALKELPSSSTVMDANLMDKATQRANACPQCRDWAFVHLRDVNETFGRAVDIAISKVTLDLARNDTCRS